MFIHPESSSYSFHVCIIVFFSKITVFESFELSRVYFMIHEVAGLCVFSVYVQNLLVVPASLTEQINQIKSTWEKMSRFKLCNNITFFSKMWKALACEKQIDLLYFVELFMKYLLDYLYAFHLLFNQQSTCTFYTIYIASHFHYGFNQILSTRWSRDSWRHWKETTPYPIKIGSITSTFRFGWLFA
jgi:hypothetical protein